MARYNNILETVGNTPVVKLNKIGPDHVDIYVKVEAFNPLGSVKDRLALGVIEAAEKDGSLKPGQTVVEATSGNTGIGLAMVCAQKGYPLVVTMAESFSVERRKLMRFLGAKVVLTPAAEKGTGMLNKARELAEKHGWFLTRQFENEANADMHARTTAPEILSDFESQRLDYWVTGAGTSGTLKGVSRVLKKERPEVKIVVAEPDNSVLLNSGHKQAYREDGSPAESFPGFRPHMMQGWTPDFVPKLGNDVLEAGLIDEFVAIAGDDAVNLSKALAQEEGIFVGITAGATLSGAIKIAEKAEKGSVILAMLPDTGERYLSTPLFEGIAEEMTDEEITISKSTPGYRFDVSPAPAAKGEPHQVPEAKPEARKFLEETLANKDEPIAFFALEWCEFCWAVRKLFKEMGIEYHSIDLDSVEYQNDNWGGDIRGALLERLHTPTIPQIFVGGEYIGGCTETFDAINDGHFQGLLEKNGVAYDKSKDVDPYSFLPKWLVPR